jgi:peptide subunit release factor 1 (eRF1)
MISLDKTTIDIHCPQCDFINEVTLGQIRLQEITICRGCKANIELIDSNNSVRKAKETIEKQLKQIEKLLRF